MIERPRRTFQGVDAFLPQEPLYIDSQAATTRASHGIDCLKVLMVMLPQHEFTDVLKQWPVTPQDTHCHRHIHVSCIQLLRIDTSRSLSQNQLLNSSPGLFHFWNVDIPAKPPEFVGSAALRAMQHSSSLPSLEGRCSRLVESALYVARGLGWNLSQLCVVWGFRKVIHQEMENFTGFDSAKLQKFEYKTIDWQLA